jgi:Haem-binding uptake, Tiki superfamily, ChaN/PDZ domain
VVAAVRKKGLANLTPEESAHLPKDIDIDNADHMTFFRTTFEDEQGPVHGAGMGEDMWKNMLSAQCTWDATMGFNAVEALKQANDPKAIMVVLVGSGHVAYGLGIERQARKWFDGTITSIIPVAVTMQKVGPIKSVRASYANFTWGVPEEIDSMFPTLGTSTAVGQGDTARRVIIVQKDSAADRAGIKVGDVMTSLDGTPLADKETFSRLMALKRWGDTAVIAVRRGEQTLTLTAVFRRTLPL